MGSNVTGTFGAPNTTLVFSPDKLEASSLKGSVSVNTINTGISKRDEDLKSSKYFDAGNHPRIDLASTKLAQNGDKYIGTFNITIKGTSKQIEIPFEFTQSGSNAEFKGNFTINRRDFGVGTKGGLARFLSDDVHVHIAIKAKS
jgi:polyisoprenoid-binding protein YceI